MLQRRLPLWSLLIGLCSILVAVQAVAAPQGPDQKKALQVKAAFVVNFAKYTSWPGNSFESDDEPIRIVAIGRSDLGNVLESASRGRKVGSHALTVTTIDFIPDGSPGRDAFVKAVRGSHIVVVPDSQRAHAQGIVAAAKGAPVLTIGDCNEFCRDGGMLQFIPKGDKIAFNANPKAIGEGQLKVSSKLLRLAEIVETRR